MSFLSDELFYDGNKIAHELGNDKVITQGQVHDKFKGWLEVYLTRGKLTSYQLLWLEGWKLHVQCIFTDDPTVTHRYYHEFPVLVRIADNTTNSVGDYDRAMKGI